MTTLIRKGRSGNCATGLPAGGMPQKLGQVKEQKNDSVDEQSTEQAVFSVEADGGGG